LSSPDVKTRSRRPSSSIPVSLLSRYGAGQEGRYQLLAAPLLVLLLVITGLPLLQALVSSFFSDSFGVRTWIGLKGYRFVLQDRALGITINITLLWSFLSVSFTLFASYLLAERLHLSKKRSISLYAALLVPWVVPIFISVPLWRALLYGNGGDSLFSALFGFHIPLTTSPPAAFLVSVLVSVWLGLPFTTLVIFGSMKKINHTIIDAAALDGCTGLQLTLHIYLPSLREPLLILGVLAAVSSFKEFSMLYLLTAGGPPLISGITENFIVGATSTVGIFLYQVFSGFTDYGITAVFGIFLACGVAVIMLIWAALRLPDERRRLTLINIYSFGLHMIWFRPFHAVLVPLMLLVQYSPTSWTGITHNRKKLLTLLTAAETLGTILSIITYGILEGFLPPLLFSLLILLTHPADRRLTGFSRKQIISSAAVRAKAVLLRTADFLYSSIQFLTAALFGIASLLIVYLLIWLSFSRGNIVSFTGFIPLFPSASSYGTIFTDYQFGRALLNTLLIALPTAVLIPFLIVPGAYGLSRMQPARGDRWVTAIQTIGTAGGIHTLIPLITVIGILGLLDTRAAVILLYVGHSIPRATLIMKAFFQDIPESLYETAALEGCGFRKYLKHILVPLSFPAILTIMMTSFLGAWNGFLVPLLFLGSENKFPVSITLFRFVGSGDSGSPLWSLFAAASVVDMVIVGGLFLLVKRPLGTTRLSEFQS